jgi:hypothetical protein
MYYYIVNPASGSHLIESIQDKLKIKLHKLKIDGEFSKTLGSGDARKIAKKAIADGFKTIVAVGGNDTINEVISAVYESPNRDVAVGVIPTGKRNLLATRLGINDWEQACYMLSARRLRSYNLMEINGHVFINCCEFLDNTSVVQDTSTKFFDRFKKSDQKLVPIEFIMKLQEDIAFRGQTSIVRICNQKLINSNLDNALLIQIIENNSDTANNFWLQRLRGQAKSYPAYTQFTTKHIQAEFSKSVQALFDGRKIIKNKFSVSLTSAQVKMVVAKSKLSAF